MRTVTTEKVRAKSAAFVSDLVSDQSITLGAISSAFMQNTAVAVFAKALDGRYVLVNAMCEQLWRIPAEQIVGRTDLEILPEADARRLMAHDREVVEGGHALEFEESANFPEGSRDFVVSKMPIRDGSGRVIGLCGVATDITARKAAERLLQESEARFRSMADSTPVLIWMSDQQKKGIYFNRRWLEFTGRRLEQELGTGWLADVHPDDFPALEVCEAALESRRPFTTQFRLRAASGEYHWMLDSGAPRFNADGEFLGFIGSCVDITDRIQAELATRQSEERLREADRRKDEFLAVLSHELRNPLAPLCTGLDLLEHARGNPELIESIRPMLNRQLAHLMRLVDDLLDISRISRGKVSLHRTALDLNAPIRAAAEQVRSIVTEFRHELLLELSDAPLPVRGDFERLTQVVANLLSNAARYMQPRGRIVVKSETGDGQAVVRVRDTGFGIPPERLDRLFKLFSQVPEHHALTGGGGLGIGLALSRELVEMHGGSIEVESRGLGHGSEFIVRLPVDEGETAMSESIGSEATSGPGRRVLVVDDNVDAADTLGMMLKLKGHDTQAVYDGSSALEHLPEFKPDIVLLDVGLPGMDGYEVARRIRQQPGGDRILLVAVTGWGQEDDKERAREAGFDEHLVKPVEAHRLAALIDARD